MSNRKFAHFMGFVARITAVIAIAVVVAAGCSGGGKTSSGGGQSGVPQITGSWSGAVRIISGGPACGGSAKLILKQDGTDITGTYSATLNCAAGTANGTLWGTWDADSRRFVLTDDEGAEYLLRFDVIVSGGGSRSERLLGTVTEGTLVSELVVVRSVGG